MTKTKTNIKRILLLACCLALLPGLLGCKKKEDASDRMDFLEDVPPATGSVVVPEAPPTEGQPDGAALTIAQEEPQAYGAATGQPGSVEVLDTAAYAFAEGRMLYGGIAYRNAGSAPVLLKEATFTFHFSGGSQRSSFAPVAAEFDVVNPGETAYCTLWLPYEKEGELPQEVTVSAELTAEATDRVPCALRVGSEFLVQNYPRFVTLSGRLTNPTQDTVDLIMVNVGFYDAADKLLGVWYFPRNALLQPGEGVGFVSHLRSLPIPGIAENTASMRFRAFGM